MINTIEACEKELMRIDSEFARLRLEREHILNVRKFLETKPTVQPYKPLTQRILEVLKANPGINAVTISMALNDETVTTRQVSFTLANMRKEGRVENRGGRDGRGGRGRLAEWYIKETTN